MTTHRPNTDQLGRDALEDLGLIDDDRTEDLSALVVGEGAPAFLPAPPARLSRASWKFEVAVPRSRPAVW